MKINGIIAEYNPFHNGHKYQLQECKRLTGADYTVVVMSGNFIQRGAPALLNKHIRAEMALRCGADLVLELPSQYATASAEYFAAGAVSLLDKLGAVSHLCFGSECGDIDILVKIASVLAEEPENFTSVLKDYLHRGYSYPTARLEALAAACPDLDKHRDVLTSPNNILGIEYCKALLKFQSNMKPVTIKRIGSGYHDEDIRAEANFSSATAIRKALFTGNGINAFAGSMPAEAYEILSSFAKQNSPLCSNDLSALLYYKLLTEKEYGYEKYLDISSDLSDRIKNNLNAFVNFDSFCELLKTKDMTYTRISRCLLHILLDIKKEDMEFAGSLHYTPYARVLGFRRESTPLLAAMKANASIPLITKLADAEKNLSAETYEMLKKDILISEIYNGVMAGRTGKVPANEFTTPIVIL